MKRSLGCHSNRGEGESCGTTVRGPCHATDNFRALRCLSVVWKHKHDVRAHLAHRYPSTKTIFSSFQFRNQSVFSLKSNFLSFFPAFCHALLSIPSHAATVPLLILHFVPPLVMACLHRFRGEIIKWFIQLWRVTSGTNCYRTGPHSFSHRMKPCAPAACTHTV